MMFRFKARIIQINTFNSMLTFDLNLVAYLNNVKYNKRG